MLSSWAIMAASELERARGLPIVSAESALSVCERPRESLGRPLPPEDEDEGDRRTGTSSIASASDARRGVGGRLGALTVASAGSGGRSRSKSELPSLSQAKPGGGGGIDEEGLVGEGKAELGAVDAVGDDEDETQLCESVLDEPSDEVDCQSTLQRSWAGKSRQRGLKDGM